MALLNAQQRQELREELRTMKFGKATGKLRTMDRKGRLAYYRNIQYTDQLSTRYVLPSLGVQVTLIELSDPQKSGNGKFFKQKYEIEDVVVEPTADNDR